MVHSIDSTNTKTLVVADSNLRNIRGLPRDTEVHIFPGANMDNTARIISKLENKRNVDTIVVHVGINNRNQTWNNTQFDVNKLLSSLKRSQLNYKVIGVSIPPGLPAAEKEHLAQINTYVETRINEDSTAGGCYVKPLPSEQVSVSPTDKYRIHYDQGTLDKLSSKICELFLGVAAMKPPQN